MKNPSHPKFPTVSELLAKADNHPRTFEELASRTPNQVSFLTQVLDFLKHDQNQETQPRPTPDPLLP